MSLTATVSLYAPEAKSEEEKPTWLSMDLVCFSYRGRDQNEVTKALAWGTKLNKAPKNSLNKMNSILMQYFTKSKSIHKNPW